MLVRFIDFLQRFAYSTCFITIMLVDIGYCCCYVIIVTVNKFQILNS